MNAIIQAHRLSKHYGPVHALDGLDLDVGEGEVHGYLGPNGAGKSTTIRILLGLARKTGGEVSVFGQDPWVSAASLHSRIVTVPGDVALWPSLSGGEIIDYFVRLRGGDTHQASYRSRRAELIERFQFEPGKKARSYSKGNRQKVALIAAFAHPAELYIFDEPTSGLDPLMEETFTQLVGEVARDGATVLLSSHILSEVERLCERVSIIRAGKIVDSGTLAELRHLTRTTVSFERGTLTEAAITAIPGAHEVIVNEGRISFTVDSDRVAASLPELARLAVTGLQIAPPTLEELFLRHYEQPAPSPDDITGTGRPGNPADADTSTGTGSTSPVNSVTTAPPTTSSAPGSPSIPAALSTPSSPRLASPRDSQAKQGAAR